MFGGVFGGVDENFIGKPCEDRYKSSQGSQEHVRKSSRSRLEYSITEDEYFMDITLALGGGGAKGNAHLGVIRRLEKEGFRVRGVAGTSFGGLVAVLYALGYSPDKIEEVFASLDQNKFYGHAPNDGPSLIGLAGVTR